MITEKTEARGYETHYDITGLSTDVKPTHPNMSGDSTFYEIDTKKAYMWDAENKQWVDM